MEVLVTHDGQPVRGLAADDFEVRDNGVLQTLHPVALEKAPVDGPGITLEDIWHYVRKHTLAYTTRHNRRQVPQQFVARLRSTAPLYFSFPVERSARLVLSESLQGRFVLAYADGQLVETIDKPRGERRQVLGAIRATTYCCSKSYVFRPPSWRRLVA